MKKHSLSILGGGNLGTSLAKGLIYSKQYSKKELLITEKRESRIDYLKSQGFQVTQNNGEAVAKSKIIVTSVKPQQFSILAEEIKGNLTPEHILISTVTGVSFKDIENILGNIPMLRIMPNTALEICESMTCIAFKNTSA